MQVCRSFILFSISHTSTHYFFYLPDKESTSFERKINAFPINKNQGTPLYSSKDKHLKRNTKVYQRDNLTSIINIKKIKDSLHFC